VTATQAEARLFALARDLRAVSTLDLADAVAAVCEAYGCTSQTVENCSPRGTCSACDAKNEAAYERQCQAFYAGGSGPQTLDEQHRAAWALKRRLRG